MRTLNIKANKDEKPYKFTRKMERFVAFIEHFGLIPAGGWNTKKMDGNFYLDLHKSTCCNKMPNCDRLTYEIRAKLSNWLTDHDLTYRWTR